MAEVGNKSSTQIWLSEARALLAKGYGGASQLAEKLLREEGAAGRLPWGYLRRNGDARDDEFWRFGRINFEENSAFVGVTLFFAGPGVGHDGGLRSTEYLGIWVSRAYVLALLPKEPSEREEAHGAGTWIVQEARRMKAAGEISDGIKITDLAKELERRMKAAAAIDRSLRAVGWRYIKNMLPVWGCWPVSSIK